MKATNASFNYTNRKRIERDEVSIRAQVIDGDGVLTIERLDIAALGLPDHAEIILEVRTARRRVVRLTAGAVAAFVPGVPLQLGESTVDGLGITLKIVDYVGRTRGIILALGQGLRPEFGADASALLPLSVVDLGDRVWNLNLDPELGPGLELNEKIEDHFSLYRDPIFRALVLPSVVKQIATWVVAHRDEDPESSIGEIVDLWSRFFRERGNDVRGVNGEEEEEVQAWADDVAQKFSSSHSALETFLQSFGRGEE